MSTLPAPSTPSSVHSWISSHQPLIETALLVMLAALLLTRGLFPGWKILNTDFPNYYVAARLIREHYSLDRLYDWIWFQRVADHFGVGRQLVGFLGLTPLSALPIVPLSWLPVLEAKRLWIVCNVTFLGTAVHLLSAQTGLSARRAWLIALCAIFPLRTSFLSGQMHILVLLLLVAAYLCHMRGWQMRGGFCIAFGAALKIYPILFCLYFVMKRRWKSLGAVLLGTALCLPLSYFITGATATKMYYLQQLPRSLQGESQNPFSSLTSSSALFHRLFLFEPELNPHPLISSPRLYATLYSFWQAALTGLVLFRLRTAFEFDDREELDWSMFLCLLLFLSSASASYQFVILIAAAVPTVSVLVNRRRWRSLLAYLLLYVAACNVQAFSPSPLSLGVVMPLLYLTLWCGVALLAFYFVFLTRSDADSNRRHNSSSRLSAFTAATLVITLWFLNGAGTWFRLKDIYPIGANRGVPRDGAYLRIEPTHIDHGLLYVAMLPDGYRVIGGDNASISLYRPADLTNDQLTFTSNSSGSNVWVEEASSAGSRVVHLLGGEPDPPACQIDNGESPALSSDERRLAFLREDHGHGSLWIVDPRDCALRIGKASPTNITSPLYDVRTLATGPSGTFLMSAAYLGRERIFTVSPGNSPQPLTGDDDEANSPAISPNGKLLVMRRLVAARWQLALLDLSSGKSKQLTRADCNAYTPAWTDDFTVVYATDCMRGLGLTSLESLKMVSEISGGPGFQ